MPSLRCYNKGCGKEFSPDDNGSNACQYHPGEPIFHDAKKKWSCCNKYSTDFEKPAPEINIAPPVQPAPNPIPKVPLARPSSDAPLKVLAPVVSPSLKTALEALRKNDTSITDAISDRDPKSCFNNGCKATFHGPESNTETCMYHSGIPVFHEGCKYWSCCQRKTTEFETFLAQEGCTAGRHAWTKEAAIANGTFFAPLTSQCRFDWFQMPGTVTLSVYAKNVLPESADVRCNSVFLTLSFLYDGGKSHFERSFNLFGVIDPETSRLNLMATKLEVVMRKAEACSWSALEVKAPTPAGEEANKATN